MILGETAVFIIFPTLYGTLLRFWNTFWSQRWVLFVFSQISVNDFTKCALNALRPFFPSVGISTSSPPFTTLHWNSRSNPNNFALKSFGFWISIATLSSLNFTATSVSSFVVAPFTTKALDQFSRSFFSLVAFSSFVWELHLILVCKSLARSIWSI